VTLVWVVSMSPFTSTLESTSTFTFSPSTEGEGATVEAASSSADCKVALAAWALASFASFIALVCLLRGDAFGLTGDAILLGDADLVDRALAAFDDGVGLETGSSHFGGGEMCFLALAGLCVIS
jgi:hypothetical protein